MSCNCTPFIYVVNNSNIYVENNGDIPLGIVARQQCDKYVLNGNGIICKDKGAFEISVNITLIPAVASSLDSATPKITVFKDGKEIQGATAAATTTGQNQSANLNIEAVTRNDAKVSSVISLRLNGCAGMLQNCTVKVKSV